MECTVRPVVTAAIDDLERACDAIDGIRRTGAEARLDGFELAEASHAAHRALAVLRGRDWTPGLGSAATTVRCEAP